MDFMQRSVPASLALGVVVLLISHTEAYRCKGSYIGDCRVEMTCQSTSGFDLNDIYIDNGNRQIECQRFGRDDLYEYWNSLDFILTYKDYELPSDQNSIPNVNNFPNSLIIQLNVGFNGYATTPVFIEMSNLQTLNLTGNMITQAKMYNKNSLSSLRLIDYSHNLINSFEFLESSQEYHVLTHLNLSHNNIHEVPEETFGVLRNLQSLDLSFNDIDRLEVMFFGGLSELRTLSLSSNRLEDCSGSFDRLGKLEELYLDNNKLTNLKARDFGKLKKLRVLILNSNYIITIENSFLKGISNLETLSLNNNLIEIVSKNCFEGLEHLKSVDLSFNNIRALYRNIFKGNNITSFSIEGNKLSGSINRGIFEGISLDTNLDLSKQNITGIGDYTFNVFDKLISLNISHNIIENLSKYCFRSLKSLIALDLSDNRIVSIDFDKTDLSSLQSLNLENNFIIKLGYFSGLVSLQRLELANNNITNVNNGVFKQLNELVTFDLSKNPLVGDVEADTLDGLNSLIYLNLSQTFLSVLKNSSFHNMENLIYLDISRSNITQIESNVFSNDVNLRMIDASHNKLKDFQVDNNHLLHLNELYLQNNLLSRISESYFIGLSNLSILSVSQNDILEIESKAFDSLKELRNLDLSYNTKLNFNGSFVQHNRKLEILTLSGTEKTPKLTNMEHLQLNELSLSSCNIKDIKIVELSQIGHLSSLDLSHNAVTVIEVGEFENLTNLRVLDLSYNNINVIQPGSFKTNMFLKLLNISHNNLSTIQYGIFHGMAMLNSIDISYNNIQVLKSEQFNDIPSLRNLIVDSNKIKSIDMRMINHIEKLSIGNNPIKCEDVTQLRHYPFNITALKLNVHSENVYGGITCNVDRDSDITDGTDTDTTDQNKGTELGTISVLRDIKSILLKIGNRTTSPKVGDIDSNFELEKSLINQIKNITGSLQVNRQDDDRISEVVTNTNRTNILLRRLLDIMTLTAQTQFKTTTDLSSSSNNTNTNSSITSDLASLADGTRKEIELKNILDHNKLIDLEEKITSIIARFEDYVKVEKKSSKYTNENFELDKRENGTVNGHNTFTEVCIAFILIILVATVVYKLYELGIFTRTRRSASARHITESIESANF